MVWVIWGDSEGEEEWGLVGEVRGGGEGVLGE